MLTVHSGSVFFPANPVLDAAIREVLVSGPEIPVDYYAEYLEADRFGSQRRRRRSPSTFAGSIGAATSIW